MRVVDVCAFYSPFGGGVRTYVEAKLKAATRLGHEMILLVPGDRHEIIERGPGALVVKIPSPTLPVDRRYRYFDDEGAVHRALDEWRPDHVEASSPWSSATMVGRWDGAATRSLVMHSDPLGAYAYRWLGAFASVNTIDRWFGWFWRHLRGLDGLFDLVVSANGDLTERLRSGGMHKVETFPMGVEAGLFSPALRSPDLRERLLGRLGLGPEAILLVGLGRFSAEKRWDMVIKAVERAAQQLPVGLLLAGDGPKRRSLESLASRSSGTVISAPIADRSEVARLLASADALVHGCDCETFCMVAAEARASGLPLIVPDRGAARDQLVGGAGLSYSAGDAAALASAIRQFTDCGVELQHARAVKNSRVRSFDEHFSELFRRYSALHRAAGTARLPIAGQSFISGSAALAISDA
jgi:alpha-1,6-mannosyltransferase